MKVRHQIFRDIGRYVPSSYLSQAIDVLTAVLVRRFLGPAMMGIWAFCNVLLTYAKYAGLGATDVAIKEIPYNLAKGNKKKAGEIRDLVFTFTTLMAVIIGLGVWGYAQFIQKKISPELYWGLLVVGVVIVLQRIHNLLISFLRAHKDFKLISKQVILSSLVNCALVLLLASQFGLYGYFGAVVGSYMFNITYVQLSRRFPIHWRLDFVEIKPILKIGFPLLLFGILNVLFQSADKLVITRFLGFEALGYYSLAAMAHGYLYSLPNLIGIVLFPYFQERFGKHESSESLAGYVLTPITVLAGLLPLPVGVAWLSAPLMTRWILPEFIPGIVALQILILGTFFLSLCHPLSHFLITTNKFRELLGIGNFMALTIFLINWGLVKGGWGLKGIAAGTAFSFFLNFFCLYLAVGLHLDWKIVGPKLSRILLIFAYFSTLLLILNRWFLVPHSQAAETLGRVLVYLVAVAPIIWRTGRETRFFREMTMVVSRARGRFITEEAKEGALEQ